jgi:hypothetical protein
MTRMGFATLGVWAAMFTSAVALGYVLRTPQPVATLDEVLGRRPAAQAVAVLSPPAKPPPMHAIELPMVVIVGQLEHKARLAPEPAQDDLAHCSNWRDLTQGAVYQHVRICE